jgi:hypothetical protein
MRFPSVRTYGARRTDLVREYSKQMEFDGRHQDKPRGLIDSEASYHGKQKRHVLLWREENKATALLG